VKKNWCTTERQSFGNKQKRRCKHNHYISNLTADSYANLHEAVLLLQKRTSFYGLEALPVVQPTLIKYSMKVEPLTSGLVSDFLLPPMDS